MKTSKSIILIHATILWISMLGINYNCSTSRLPAEYRTDTLYTNINGNGDLLEIHFRRGTEHNHPLMAIWIEDTLGNYIQTLYVAESIAKGVFGHGDKSTGKWMPGVIRRPASLPVWAHQRGVKESDGLFMPTQETAIPDAYTGATPAAHFILYAKTDTVLPEQFYVYFEINQSWDWNNYWTNNKYPDDEDYKTSCQPALIYRAKLNYGKSDEKSSLELIGHSHYSGDHGEIYNDLSTITTAKDITESIAVRLVR